MEWTPFIFPRFPDRTIRFLKKYVKKDVYENFKNGVLQVRRLEYIKTSENINGKICSGYILTDNRVVFIENHVIHTINFGYLTYCNLINKDGTYFDTSLNWKSKQEFIDFINENFNKYDKRKHRNLKYGNRF